jgi:hypothetical protein
MNLESLTSRPSFTSAAMHWYEFMSQVAIF